MNDQCVHLPTCDVNVCTEFVAADRKLEPQLPQEDFYQEKKTYRALSDSRLSGNCMSITIKNRKKIIFSMLGNYIFVH